MTTPTVSGPIEQGLVTHWLESMGVGHEPLSAEAPGYRWAIRTTTSETFSVVVAQRDVDRPHLFLQLGITVSEGHRKVLESLGEDELALFVMDLRLALLQQPVGFALEFADDAGTSPTSVSLGFNILEESPQLSGFFRRHHQLQMAAQVAVTMFKKLALRGQWP